MLFSYALVMSHLWTASKYRHYPSYGTDFRSWHGQEIVKQVMQGYDKNLRPRGYGGDANAPTIVHTSLAIKSISTVKEQNMEYKVQFRFKQEWYDDRLKFRDWYFKPSEFVHMGSDYDKKIWIPDTFFQNEKDGTRHHIDKANYFIKFRADGKIIYDRRLSMTFSCIMDLSKYPMDSQTCLMDFASYAYTTNDIIYEWQDDEPLSFRKGATSGLPNFVITGYKNGSCSSVTNTGSYSCLRVELNLRRVFSFFLLQLYVPSSMLVAVSWVSYWIDWRATAGRVPLAIITLLTMITQSHVINAALPPVSYTKAIDVWIGACVAFIFGALIEYAIVNYTGIQEQRRKSSAMSSLPITKSDTSYANFSTNGVWDWLQRFLGPMNRTRRKQRRVDDVGVVANEGLLRTRSLRKRSRIGSANRKYSSGAFEVTPQTYEEGHHSRTMPESCLGGMVVHFEDISNNVAWIRRKTRYRHRIATFCATLKKHGRAERIDVISRTIFPLAFILFNIVYWIVYW